MTTSSVGDRVAARVRLTASRLQVELHQNGTLRVLDVRSLVDPRQAFLLPLPCAPAIEGLSLPSRLSRIHALYWALAYGSSRLPVGCVVRFSTNTLRFRRTVVAVPHQLSTDCWVADAEGLFGTAATVVDDVETARVRLADHWSP
jgi:hypothetical protein